MTTTNATTRQPPHTRAALQPRPRVRSPQGPADSDRQDATRSRSASGPAAAGPAPLTAGQALALVLLRDGLTEGSIRLRTGTRGDDLYRLAAAHGITAPHSTVEGHRCHEAAGTEPCDGCSLAAARDQARALARHRRSVSSLPPAARRQNTRKRTAS